MKQGVPLSHDKVESVARISSARDPPLEPVDDDLVSLLADRELDVGGTGREEESGKCNRV